MAQRFLVRCQHELVPKLVRLENVSILSDIEVQTAWLGSICFKVRNISTCFFSRRHVKHPKCMYIRSEGMLRISAASKPISCEQRCERVTLLAFGAECPATAITCGNSKHL